MAERIAEASARFKARMAGAFYMLMALSGGLAVFARRGLREKENAYQTNALSPPIVYCQPIMCLTERHTQI